MLIVKIEALSNGAHNNQTYSGKYIPNGYAVVPPNVGTAKTLENFPFGDITVEEINGIPTVTSWTPLPMPEPEPETEDDVWAELDRAYTEGVNTAYDQ